MSWEVTLSQFFEEHQEGCTPSAPCPKCQALAFARQIMGQDKVNRFLVILEGKETYLGNDSHDFLGPDLSVLEGKIASTSLRMLEAWVRKHSIQTYEDLLFRLPKDADNQKVSTSFSRKALKKVRAVLGEEIIKDRGE